ncbi:GNAT family N-acetyltransferase [Alteromonas sp. D210916BOD_24]|uniref:GNAT family N-acetyltransferase n=1 Tax=Alteromonas sp. D210916BOD_24 TaxID=3157618 RepID=UPI00399CF78F
MDYKIRVIDQISDLPKEHWNSLVKDAGPFLAYDFLSAMEESGCCGDKTGWIPCHIVVYKADKLEIKTQPAIVIPGYLKTHSYGEYVFDHAWANAYHQHGVDYYPKWIAAIPFTPVTGPRILTHPNTCIDSALIEDIEHTITHYVFSVYGAHLSSFHWLFPDADTITSLPENSGFLERYSVQFQWHNYDYTDFNDFLAALTSRKRKEIKKLRRTHSEKGIRYSHKTGNAIDPTTLAFFIKCYQATYLKRSGHEGYLNAVFFEKLIAKMSENILIVTAFEYDTPVASAIFFYDGTGLYGRYWGSVKEISGLHFGCCYFEGIAFAIKQQLPLFNPGTQGEHKILRGFEPVYCRSKHKLCDRRFHQAVAHFLQQEKRHMTNYFNQARNALPFNMKFVPTLKTTSVTSPDDDTHYYNEKTYET